ncbi:MAG TPA: sensor domain-containing diguanylate cyclase [Terriglobales bacterium]|nr:sensor domain-containing diguanylate cyclase [Terriglobales bacterium]
MGNIATLTALLHASQTVLSTFELPKVLQRILSIAGECLQVPYCAVLLADRQGTLRVDAQRGWTPEAACLKFASGSGVVGEAAKHNRVVNVGDLSKLSDRVPLPEARSELTIPLVAGNRVVGVFDLQSTQESFFDEARVQLAKLLAVKISLAVRDAWLRKVERQRASQMDAISAIARQTATLTEFEELLARFCALVLQAFPVDHVAILLLDEQRLVLRSHCGRLSPSLQEGRELSTEAGLCGRALATQSPVFSEDIGEDLNYAPFFSPSRSELAVPLISFGQALGVLLLASRKEDAFGHSDLRPFESIADVCAAVLQNAMHFDQVRRLAYRDGLTGLFNRRFYEMRLPEEMERARRYSSTFSLMLIDLDGFKGLNDCYGHQVGDEVLRRLAGLFSRHFRRSDIVCRFGGDEFAVLLPQTSAACAFAAAEKLNRELSQVEIPNISQPVTLSIGIASYPEHAQVQDELLRAADGALYRVKQAGRNGVSVAVEATSTNPSSSSLYV